ncbi:MAG: hypothetical protein KDB94_05745 [Acidobacteria bacterium]|nr:hypothetical protein [Acidobacteriota bacterium]
MIVKRIEPMSLAKVMAMIYGGLGLIFGALFSLFAMVGSGLAAAAAEGGPVPSYFGVVFGLGAVIVLPLLYGFFGFLGGLIVSGLYNATSKFTGGVQLEVD